MKQKLSLLLFVGLLPLYLFAQQVTITGTVTDESNESLPGVSVFVKGTTRGTSTDLDGRFSIMAAPSETLVFSMVGMVTQSIPVGNNTHLNIIMQQEATALEEVVVVGYGTQRAKDLTAPIVKVGGDDLSKQATSNAMQALQGKASGVQIINSGVPGSGASIKIRGIGSIGDYANPLFVVDGVFVDNIDFLAPPTSRILPSLKMHRQQFMVLGQPTGCCW